MTIMTFITAACVASTLSLVFIWFAEHPVEPLKLQVFATVLYLLFVGSSVYYYNLEQDKLHVSADLAEVEASYDESLLALEEQHADALAWQAIQNERDVTEKLEARLAAREDTMKDNLFQKVFDLEEVIKTQRTEMYALENELREAHALNEQLESELAALQDDAITTADETDVFFEVYGSCTDLNAVYPDGVPLEHDAYLLSFDTDLDGIACGANDVQ
ncbi:excalibur calcium-binding domain protein [Exiguobacterium sp. S17]|nr:excalibur calcium-binding domain protein [Exiguobacterium sp. S17]